MLFKMETIKENRQLGGRLEVSYKIYLIHHKNVYFENNIILPTFERILMGTSGINVQSTTLKTDWLPIMNTTWPVTREIKESSALCAVFQRKPSSMLLVT